MGQWVAAFFTWGLVINPRLARLIAALFNMVVIADFLQIAYTALMDLSARVKPNRDQVALGRPETSS